MVAALTVRGGKEQAATCGRAYVRRRRAVDTGPFRVALRAMRGTAFGVARPSAGCRRGCCIAHGANSRPAPPQGGSGAGRAAGRRNEAGAFGRAQSVHLRWRRAMGQAHQGSAEISHATTDHRRSRRRASAHGASPIQAPAPGRATRVRDVADPPLVEHSAQLVCAAWSRCGAGRRPGGSGRPLRRAPRAAARPRTATRCGPSRPTQPLQRWTLEEVQTDPAARLPRRVGARSSFAHSTLKRRISPNVTHPKCDISRKTHDRG
jgi:hypothetical protein